VIAQTERLQHLSHASRDVYQLHLAAFIPHGVYQSGQAPDGGRIQHGRAPKVQQNTPVTGSNQFFHRLFELPAGTVAVERALDVHFDRIAGRTAGDSSHHYGPPVVSTVPGEGKLLAR
jgi:hypothetical protein